MTRAEIRQSVKRLIGDRRAQLAHVRAHRNQLGAGVVAADWKPADMDDTTLLALVVFGLLALWQWTETGDQGEQLGGEPLALPSWDGGSPAPVPEPNPTPQPTPQPRPQPPTQGGDQIDLSQAVIVGGSPDFRGWPITTQLSISGLEPAIVPAFADPGWPDIVPAGWDGPLQYTVCAFAQIGNGGGWVGSGIVQMWRGRPDCGANQAETVRHQLWRNWWYYIPELAGYLPAPGDAIAFCVCAGNLRNGQGPLSVFERSNVVVLTMP